MFLDIPYNSFKVGWTFVMIMEDSIPNVVDKLCTASTYFSTFWSLSFFKFRKKGKMKKSLVNLFHVSYYISKQWVKGFFLVPSHCEGFVAHFGIPPVSSVTDHSHSP